MPLTTRRPRRRPSVCRTCATLATALWESYRMVQYLASDVPYRVSPAPLARWRRVLEEHKRAGG